jgi:multidrug efflux system membrane fusion protein
MDDRTTRNFQETRPEHEQPAMAQPAKRRRFPWGIILALLAIAAALAWWFHERPAPQPTGRARANATTSVPVVADIAQKGDIDITLNGLGTVTPLATVTVRTQINGQLTDVGFKEGQLVKKGDFLAQIDPRPYQAALEQAEGQMARDQGLLDQARMDLKRYETLAKTNAVPRQQYEDQIYLVKQNEGTVKTDQAQIDTQKLNLAYCHIVSPVEGRVGLRLVDPGNYVQTSDTSGVVVVTQLQPITVVFTVAEDNVPQIFQRLHANATLPVSAYDRSGTTKLATGTLMTTDNQIDTTTGTLKLKAQFANDDESLFPNQFVNIQLLVDVLHDATVVPMSAVQRGAPGTFVYLVNADSTVSVRPIALGASNGDRVAVRSGLSLGDRVVVDGADKLRDGAKVTLRDGSGAATQPAPNSAAPNPGTPNPAAPNLGTPKSGGRRSPQGQPK